MNKSLDIGKIYSDAFDMYTSHWQPLLTLSGILYAVTTAIMVGLVAIFGAIGGFVGVFVGLAIGGLISILTSIILSGMYTLLVNDLRDGSHDTSVGELFSQVTPKLGALIITGILGGLGVAVGLIFLIIPGIVLAVWWTFAAITVILEDTSGPSALGRSKELVSSVFWPVLGLVVLTAILTGIASSILSGILTAGLGKSFFGSYISSVIPNILIGPFSAIVPVLAYFQLRGDDSGDLAQPTTDTEATPPAYTPPQAPPSATGTPGGAYTPESTAYTPGQQSPPPASPPPPPPASPPPAGS